MQSIIESRDKGEDGEVDYASLSGHDFKVRQMEQQVRAFFFVFPSTRLRIREGADGDSQVEILQLENALSAARHRLGEMRKISYQEED